MFFGARTRCCGCCRSKLRCILFKWQQSNRRSQLRGQQQSCSHPLKPLATLCECCRLPIVHVRLNVFIIVKSVAVDSYICVPLRLGYRIFAIRTQHGNQSQISISISKLSRARAHQKSNTNPKTTGHGCHFTVWIKKEQKKKQPTAKRTLSI